jgi:CHASE3 domain sensor protein
MSFLDNLTIGKKLIFAFAIIIIFAIFNSFYFANNMLKIVDYNEKLNNEAVKPLIHLNKISSLRTEYEKLIRDQLIYIENLAELNPRRDKISSDIKIA